MIRSLTAGQNVGFRPTLPPKRKLLYDVMRKMEDYDESIVLATFPHDTYEALHRTRSILLDEVVKYIVEFAPHNGRRDLNRLMTEAKHLREIGMEDIALARINDAIKLATGMEAVVELYEAIKVRRKLIAVVKPAKRSDTHLVELEKWALAGMEETMQIERLESYLYEMTLLPVAEHYARVQVLEEELGGITFPALVRNQMQYRRLRYYIARQRRDIPTCIAESEAIHRLGMAHSHVLADTDVREGYFHAITFLTTAAAEARDFKAAERYLEQIKALAKTWSGGLEANPSLNASTKFVSLGIKIKSKDWKATHALSQQIFQDVVKRNVLNRVPMQGAVLRLAVLGAFLTRDFGLMRRLNLFLRSEFETSTTSASLVHFSAYIGLLTLLSYAEEGDPHIRLATKDIGNWLRTIGPLGDYEKSILAFFKKVGESTDFTPTVPSLLALRDELALMFQSPKFGKYKAMFPLHLWVEAKLTGSDLRTFDFD